MSACAMMHNLWMSEDNLQESDSLSSYNQVLWLKLRASVIVPLLPSEPSPWPTMIFVMIYLPSASLQLKALLRSKDAEGQMSLTSMWIKSSWFDIYVSLQILLINSNMYTHIVPLFKMWYILQAYLHLYLFGIVTDYY